MVELGNVLEKGFNTWWSAILMILLVGLIAGAVGAATNAASYATIPEIYTTGDFGSLGVDLENMQDGDIAKLISAYLEPTFVVTAAIGGIISMIVTLALTAFILLFFATKDAARARTVTFNRLLPLLGYTIVSTIIVALGFLLLIIPGIIAMVFFSLGVFSVVYRKKGPIEALKYSCSLVSDNWWRTLGYMLVIGLITGVLSFVLGLISIPFSLAASFAPGVGTSALSAFVAGLTGFIQTAFLYAMAREYFFGLEEEQGKSPIAQK